MPTPPAPRRFTSIDIPLGYWKKGDDYAHYQETHTGNDAEALKAHAASLQEDAALLTRLAQVVATLDPAEYSIEADTHMLQITVTTTHARRVRAALKGPRA
jgi:hypothetical protein